MRVHLVNPNLLSFGAITPRWLYALAAATPRSFGDPRLVNKTFAPIDSTQVQPGDVVGIGIHSGNALRGPDFFWSDFYLTKWFPLTERVKPRLEAQFFNVFNHPNFGMPSMVPAGIPGKPSTQTGFGALNYTTSPQTGLLGVGLGGDNSPRLIAFQLRLEF